MVYQIFRLNEEKAKRAVLLKPGQKLIGSLKEKGYTVLISTYRYNGISKIIVVGTEFAESNEMPAEANKIKSDFQKLAKKLGLYFRDEHHLTDLTDLA